MKRVTRSYVKGGALLSGFDFWFVGNVQEKDRRGHFYSGASPLLLLLKENRKSA